MGIKIKDQYATVCSPVNLYRAAKNALSKGLRFKQHGAGWKMGMEYHLWKLSEQLKDRTFKHGRYEVFKVYDPKERIILAAGITDRVVHHAIHDVIEPIIDRKFIHHSYACRLQKGQHRGVLAAQTMMRQNTYWIHLDVKKFFYSIHRATLLGIVRRTVCDEGVDWLLTHILDSSNNHALADQYAPVVQQLSLFDVPPVVQGTPLVTDKHKGLPIGNLTSQLMANWYLNEVDQFVKHRLKHGAYIRYMDDMVVFSNTKSELTTLENEITAYCSDILKLSLHPSGGPSSYRDGLTFLGFRIFRDHLRLKRASAERFRKNLAYAIAHIPFRTAAGFADLHRRVQSWNAHAEKGNTYTLRKQIFGQYPVTKFMMEHDFQIKSMNKVLRWK